MIKKITAAALVLSIALLAACSGETDPNKEATDYSDFSVADIPEGGIPEDISTADTGEMDFSFTDRDSENGYDENDVANAEYKGDSYLITSEGTYIFSGTITDKTITVEACDSDKIQIVLDNAEISNSQGVAIYIKSADKVFLTLKEGTNNSISDGDSYELADGETTLDGAIFSRADLTVNGKGSLTVNGNYKHGIVSKDDLVITSATVNVTAKNVGINGKDCVKIKDASINVNAGSDGIRSDNAEDSSRGYVYIESGCIDINADNDGIQAETAVKIATAEMNISCGSGSSQSLSDSSESYKGIKAVSDILIENGNFTIDSKDDCIHSNNTVLITGGTFSLSSGDDGIHADSDLSISAGDITVSKSYEGIESSRIFISGGKIDITASDDGLNAAGGNDQSSMGGRPGMGGFDNGVGEVLISGGYLLVNATGDGLDSNGTFAITGGIVLVSGPTNDGNGALDYGSGASVTGGTLIALGSSGMATGFTQAENQGALLYNFSSQTAGTPFAVCDSEGKVLASFTPKKSYNSAVVTTPQMVQDGTYTLVVGGTTANTDENGYASDSSIEGGTTVAQITLSSLIYNAGGGFGGFGGGSGGFGGGDHGGGFGGGGTPPGGFGGGRP